MNLTQDRNPRGHKEDRASFTNQIQYKVSIIHGSNPTLEKRGRKNKRGGRKRTGDGCAALWAPGQKGRERERGEGVRGVFMVPTQGSKIPLDLN